MPASSYGKGSDRRKSQISLSEEDLRWALWQTKDPYEKELIKQQLQELVERKNGKIR